MDALLELTEAAVVPVEQLTNATPEIINAVKQLLVVDPSQRPNWVSNYCCN